MTRWHLSNLKLLFFYSLSSILSFICLSFFIFVIVIRVLLFLLSSNYDFYVVVNFSCVFLSPNLKLEMSVWKDTSKSIPNEYHHNHHHDPLMMDTSHDQQQVLRRPKQPQPIVAISTMNGAANGAPTNGGSDLFALVVSKNQYPQLMQAHSWNLAVPFVEQRFSNTPSESIANNFTPTASKLKIRNLGNIRPSVIPRESNHHK